MYFPYFHARRSELYALRALCNDYQLADVVVPILEPVNSNPSDLIRAGIDVFGLAGAGAVVIANPYQHEFSNGVDEDWAEAVSAKIEEHPSIIPGYLCSQTTTRADVTRFLAEYPRRAVALLYWNARLTQAEVQALAAQNRVRFHINLHERMSAAQRAALPPNKAVDIRDDFIAQPKNADYRGTEFFTDRHLTFRDVAIGFGDYSVVGSAFVPGGGQPSAVAIHATYKARRTGEIWVEHFVSDDTERNVGTVGGKYQQAAEKLVAAATARPREFGNDRALQEYAADAAEEHYPGLGKNKERQIYHHTALMYQILTGAL